MKKFLVLIVSAMLIQPNILFAAEGKKMTRSDICKKNYEKLFNSDLNPNVGSDPEMMAILAKIYFWRGFHCWKSRYENKRDAYSDFTCCTADFTAVESAY